MHRTLIVAPVRKSVRVNAAPERAFEVFTAQSSRWWPRSHSINTSPMQAAIIEPRVGGRWFERGEDGSECDWGRVLVWEPPTRIVLGWQLGPDFRFDPDVVTEVEVRFIGDGSGVTRVELEHRHLERFGERGEVLREKVGSPNGWSHMLERYAAVTNATD
jgi:uncharacterized protein YndB with AHSA1/START domain